MRTNDVLAYLHERGCLLHCAQSAFYCATHATVPRHSNVAYNCYWHMSNSIVGWNSNSHGTPGRKMDTGSPDSFDLYGRYRPIKATSYPYCATLRLDLRLRYSCLNKNGYLNFKHQHDSSFVAVGKRLTPLDVPSYHPLSSRHRCLSFQTCDSLLQTHTAMGHFATDWIPSPFTASVLGVWTRFHCPTIRLSSMGLES